MRKDMGDNVEQNKAPNYLLCVRVYSIWVEARNNLLHRIWMLYKYTKTYRTYLKKLS
jgi:hypothetical protein